MIKGCMFYVAGYDRPIEIVSRIEEDKTDHIYKDGKLIDTIYNDDIKLLKVLQKIVEEMKMKDEKMETKSKATKSNKKKKKDLLVNSKVGEYLYSSEHGWGTVTEIADGDYPLCVKFSVERATFTLDGKRHKDDKYPTLFWDKAEATRKRSKKRLPNLKVGTLVTVWENDFDVRKIRQFKRFTKKGKMRCLAKSGDKDIKWPNWELAG